MQQPRESHLELLRLVAFFGILGSHYFSGTGIGSELEGPSRIAAHLLVSGSRISVNVFVLIGTWFLVDLPFKGSRPLRLYFTTAFYSIPLTLVMLLCGQPLSLQQIIQGLFPFAFMATWFTNAYISMLLFSSFLHKLLQMPTAHLKKIVALIVLLMSFPASLPWMNLDDYVSNMLWFLCVFILIGYLKHHTNAFSFGATWWYVCFAILGYMLIVFSRSSPFPQIVRVAELYRANIKTIPNIAIAYSIFVVFLRMRLGCIKWINKVAQSIFSVYVIHQVPAFADWQWGIVRRYLQPMSGSAPCAVIVNCVVACFGVFSLYFMLVQIRIKLVDMCFMKTRFVNCLTGWVERGLSLGENEVDNGK